MKQGKLCCKQILIGILALTLCFGFTPVTAFAAETDSQQETSIWGEAKNWVMNFLGLGDESQTDSATHPDATYLDATYINIRQVGTYIDAQAIDTPAAIKPMELDTDYSVEPQEDVNHNMVWYSFTPRKTQYYTFSGKDTDGGSVNSFAKLLILTKEGNQYETIHKDNDSEDSSKQFDLTYKLDADTTYYIWAGYYKSNNEKPYTVRVSVANLVSAIEFVDGDPSCYKSELDDLKVKLTYEDGTAKYGTLDELSNNSIKVGLDVVDEAQAANWEAKTAGEYNVRLMAYQYLPYSQDKDIFAAQVYKLTLKEALQITSIKPDKEAYYVNNPEDNTFAGSVKAVVTYSDGTTVTVEPRNYDQYGNYIGFEAIDDTDSHKYHLFVSETARGDHQLESAEFVCRWNCADKVEFFYKNEPLEDGINILTTTISTEYMTTHYYIPNEMIKDVSYKLTYPDGSTYTMVYDQDRYPNLKDENGFCYYYKTSVPDSKQINISLSNEYDLTIGDKTVSYTYESPKFISVESVETNDADHRPVFSLSNLNAGLQAVTFKAVFQLGTETKETTFHVGESIKNPFVTDAYSGCFARFSTSNISGEGDYQIDMAFTNYNGLSLPDKTYTYYLTIDNSAQCTIKAMSSDVNSVVTKNSMSSTTFANFILTDSNDQEYRYNVDVTSLTDYFMGNYNLCKTVDDSQKEDYANSVPGYYDLTATLCEPTTNDDGTNVLVPVEGIVPVTYKVYIPGELGVKDIEFNIIPQSGVYNTVTVELSDGMGTSLKRDANFKLSVGKTSLTYVYDSTYTKQYWIEFNCSADAKYLNDKGKLLSGTHDVTITAQRCASVYDTTTQTSSTVYYGDKVTKTIQMEGTADGSITFKTTSVPSLKVNETFTIGVTKKLSDDLTWTSSDSSVASVDQNGKVKALKAGTATITASYRDGAYSDSCKVTVVETPEVHTHTMVKTDRVEATCTTDGCKAYYTCSECHKIFADEAGRIETSVSAQTIKAGHKNIVKVEAVEPSCTKDGNFEYYKCSECGKLFIDAEGLTPETIDEVTRPMLGHQYGEWVVDAASKTKTKTCSVCGKKQVEMIDEYLTEGQEKEEIDALVNAAKDSSTSAPEAQPEVNVSVNTKDGDNVKVNNDILEAANKAAQENVKVNITVENIAVDDEGTYTWTIDGSTVSSETKTVNLEVSRTTINNVDTLDAGEKAAIINVQQSVGEEAADLVPVCQLSLAHEGTFGFTASLRVYVSVDKAGQNAYLYWYEGNASAQKIATAVVDDYGFATFENLTHASEYFVMTSADKVNPAEKVECKHSYDAGIVTKEASCTEKGVKTLTCTLCGDKKTEEIAALGHDYQDVADTAVAATCTEAGKKADQKCSRCDDTKTGETIAALGHDWNDDYTVDVEATATTAGSKSIHCKRCDATKDSQVIPATGNSGSEQTPSTPSVTTKQANVITATDITRTWSKAAQYFYVGASCQGGAALSYYSDNSNITVNAAGVVTVAAGYIGTARIYIASAETSNYNAASAAITVSVGPTGSSLKSAKNASGKKMTVKWAKNKTVNGYMIQYSTDPNFGSNVRSKVVTKNKTTSVTLKGLKKKSVYYVRMCTYKTIGGVKYYSTWSNVKKVTIKK